MQSSIIGIKMRFTFAVVAAFIASSLAIILENPRLTVDLAANYRFNWALSGDNPHDEMHLFLTNHEGNNDAYGNPRCVRIASGLHKGDQGYTIPQSSINHCVGGGEGWRLRAHKENHCFDTVNGSGNTNIWGETTIPFYVQPYQPPQPN